MAFICKYHKDATFYFRTVFADSINDATKQAEKWARKGYVLISVIERV